MATTAAQVLEQVQALGYATDTKTQQLTMLNQVHRRIINARRWTFAIAVSTLPTVANNASVTFDAAVGDTKRIDAVRLEDSSGNSITLDPIDLPTLRQYTVENDTPGTPRYWARLGNTIRLYPIPDAVYTLVIDSVNNPPVIAAEGTNVSIPDSHVDILAWGIVMQITFRERDWDGHNFARQMYAELFTEMLAQFGMQQRQQATHVTSSGQWENFDVEDAWPTSAL